MKTRTCEGFLVGIKINGDWLTLKHQPGREALSRWGPHLMYGAWAAGWGTRGGREGDKGWVTRGNREEGTRSGG